MTGHSRGFAFVYFHDLHAARYAKDAANGMLIDGQQVNWIELLLKKYQWLSPDSKNKCLNAVFKLFPSTDSGRLFIDDANVLKGSDLTFQSPLLPPPPSDRLTRIRGFRLSSMMHHLSSFSQHLCWILVRIPDNYSFSWIYRQKFFNRLFPSFHLHFISLFNLDKRFLCANKQRIFVRWSLSLALLLNSVFAISR